MVDLEILQITDYYLNAVRNFNIVSWIEWSKIRDKTWSSMMENDYWNRGSGKGRLQPYAHTLLRY